MGSKLPVKVLLEPWFILLYEPDMDFKFLNACKPPGKTGECKAGDLKTVKELALADALIAIEEKIIVELTFIKKSPYFATDF